MTAPARKNLAIRLFVHGPGTPVREVGPFSQAITIGRDSSCELCLDSSEVAATHARLELHGEQLRLTDLSGIGTVVGSRAIVGDTVALDPAAPIVIGPFRLRLQLVAGAPTSQNSDVGVAARRAIHRELLDHLDLVRLERSRMNDHLLRAKVEVALKHIVARYRVQLPVGTDAERLVEELTHEAIGLGPLEDLLAMPEVSEIMVVDPHTIYVERRGRIELTGSRFTDEESVRAIIERIVAPLGRRIDESAPMLDARLPDGSRVNAVIRPLAIRGACVTIRKFSDTPLTAEDLVRFGSVTPAIMRFLSRSVLAKKNILVSGGTGSGKTTLLNILSSAIPERERIVTIEDAAELQLRQAHVVSLESRPPNMEGRGEITIRDLVKNAMRMRPDRIIVGECRGAEALDMLQAMNTGHDGSLTTTHANSPREAMKRIETLALMAGVDIPARAIREQIAGSIDVIVQQSRMSDGSRRITGVSEVIALDDDGEIQVREIFGFRRTSTGPNGEVKGEFYASGHLPSYLGDFYTMGLVRPGEPAL